MQIFHHIGFGSRSAELANTLVGLGVSVKAYGKARLSEETSGLPRFFEMAEDDPRWQRVQHVLEQFSSEEVIWRRRWTNFTEAERTSAQVLVFEPSWTMGYPEPSETAAVAGTRHLPFFATTYDLSDYCKACLTGAVQKAPFQIIKEPTWGRRSMFRLNWVAEEIFVNRDIWERVFEPAGIQCEPVLIYGGKRGQSMSGVVQLLMPLCPSFSALAGLPHVICSECGRLKYTVVEGGFFSGPENLSAPIAKSTEYFGSLDNAFRLILVTASMYRSLRQAGAKSGEFRPIVQTVGS